LGIDRKIHNQIEALGLDADRIEAVDIGVSSNGEKIADVNLKGEVFAHRVIVSDKLDELLPEQELKSGLEAICTFPESTATFRIPKIDVIDYNRDTKIITANLRTEGFGKTNDMTPPYLRSNNESIPDYLKRVVDYTNPFSDENIANTFMAYLIAVLSTRNLASNKNEINTNLITDLGYIIGQSAGKQEFLVHPIDITDLVNISRFVERNPSTDYSVSSGETLLIYETDKITNERKKIFNRISPGGLTKQDELDYTKAFTEYMKSRVDQEKNELFEGKRVYSNLFGSLLGPNTEGLEGKHVSPGRFEFDYLKEVILKVSVE